MYSDAQIFVWDFDALSEMIKYPNEKNMLEASGRIRRLLLDNVAGGTLLSKVAHEHSFKPKFRVHSVQLPEELARQVTFSWSSANADSGDRYVGLDAFLAEPITWIQGRKITVREMINYVANVGGGIHKGLPSKRDNAESIHETATWYLPEGVPYPVYSILGICRATLDALQPLYDRLKA